MDNKKIFNFVTAYHSPFFDITENSSKLEKLTYLIKSLKYTVPLEERRAYMEAACVWLYDQEHNDIPPEEYNLDEIDDAIWDIILDVEEDAPVNAVGGGAIAGVGVGDQGEPPVRKKKRKNPYINMTRRLKPR